MMVNIQEEKIGRKVRQAQQRARRKAAEKARRLQENRYAHDSDSSSGDELVASMMPGLVEDKIRRQMRQERAKTDRGADAGHASSEEEYLQRMEAELLRKRERALRAPPPRKAPRPAEQPATRGHLLAVPGQPQPPAHGQQRGSAASGASKKSEKGQRGSAHSQRSDRRLSFEEEAFFAPAAAGRPMRIKGQELGVRCCARVLLVFVTRG